jgi:hypothetical protein
MFSKKRVTQKEVRFVNKSDAVHDLIARAPSIVRTAREGDQNSLAIIAEVGREARKGHTGFKMVYRSIIQYMQSEQTSPPMTFGVASNASISGPKQKAAAKKAAAVKAASKARANAIAKWKTVHHKAGTSVLAPQGKSSQTDDSDDDGPVADTAKEANAGDSKALATVAQIFKDAHGGNESAKSLATAIQEYTRKARLSGEGATATVVGLANGAPLSRKRIHHMSAQFGSDARAFMAGASNPHSNVPDQVSAETAKCIRLGQCVGIARNLQIARLRRTRLSTFHPSIGWEAGEDWDSSFTTGNI